MEYLGLIPAPDTIPVHWLWFEFLSLLTLSVHLLLMNLVLGGALVALAGRAKACAPAEDLAASLPTGLGLAVNLGVPPLLFLQVLWGPFLYTATVLSAWFWMAVSALGMAAYFLLYAFAWRVKRHEPGGTGRLALASALLLGVSGIMSNIMTLMIDPKAWGRYFESPGGWLLNLGDPTLLPRWLHFVLASLAVGGLYLALRNSGRARSGDPLARQRAALGLRWFLHASLAQLAIGAWFLAALPREVVLLFMGRSGLHTLTLVVALTLVGFLLWQAWRGRAAATAVTLALVTLAMVTLRDLVKAASLSGAFSPESLVVTGQYGPMIVFFASLAVGVGLIVHMLGLYRRAQGGR